MLKISYLLKKYYISIYYITYLPITAIPIMHPSLYGYTIYTRHSTRLYNL